jgi:ADP-heptose:LPS heptosyltransferase
LARGTALAILLPGLGDALACSPILRGLRRDSWSVDALTMHPPVSEYLRALGIVKNVTQLPLRPTAADALGALSDLRPRRYDICILPFPATRWQYAALARGAGARKLYMHEYGGSARLIARTAGVLGIHPGSMAWKGNESKRWPYDRFATLARRHVDSGRSVRFFLGPHEESEAARVQQDFGSVEGISIIREPLDEAARRLAECEVFVGNDAGFSHLASGLGVKTLALYGMTSEVRGAPIGQAVALRPSLCPACHDEGSQGFDCVLRIDYRCILRDVEFDAVAKVVDELFAAPFVEQRVSLEGPFKLYGKAYP